MLRVMMVGQFPRHADRIDGGVAAAMTYLCQGLVAESGLELVGVRVAPPGGHDGASDFGWPIHDLSLGRLGLSTMHIWPRKQFAQLVRKLQPDIIHGQGVDLPGSLAINSGIPSVVTVHGILGEDAKYQTEWMTRARAELNGRLIERRTVRRATDLISISPYVTGYYGRTISGRVHEIPNAIAESFFSVRRAPERGRILFAGRIINRKGVLDLVRAIARSGTAVKRLVLAGSAPDETYAGLVRSEIHRAGIAGVVEFAGLLDEPAILDEFARAEALVLPSYQETAPMVIQQAMAAGLAVVATNICGVPFQIEHDATGLLFDAGDVEQLAAIFSRLEREPTLSSRLGIAAKHAAVSRYHARKVAQATHQAYQTILASPAMRSNG